jgi:GntR family transcriptional regulator, transcriptional repressor for pyruvate dehydrogenase complex
MALRAVKPRRIHEEIVEQIREQIAEGLLKSGDQLPSERELSEKFQVSRASVREAIRALESLGLVKIKSGDGTYIASSLQTLLSPLISVILQQKDVLLDIFEARQIIEPEMAALAARRAEPEEVDQMAAILDEQARQVADGGTGMEADSAFHSMLAQAAKNKVILKLNDSIMDSLRETRERSLHTDGRPTRSLAGHRKILDAIRAKNPAGARRAMLEHLRAIEQNVLKPTEGELERKEGRGSDAKREGAPGHHES